MEKLRCKKFCWLEDAKDASRPGDVITVDEVYFEGKEDICCICDGEEVVYFAECWEVVRN